MSRIDLAGKLDAARARIDGEPAVTNPSEPRFARMARKDARIRPDQDAALTALAKSLMRRRRVKAERITENTLIRVGIDLLLAHADELHGSTENELRRSLIATPPDSGTSALATSRGSELPQFSTTDVPGTGTTASMGSRTSQVTESHDASLPPHLRNENRDRVVTP